VAMETKVELLTVAVASMVKAFDCQAVCLPLFAFVCLICWLAVWFAFV
jgi:hypothetical protein